MQSEGPHCAVFQTSNPLLASSKRRIPECLVQWLRRATNWALRRNVYSLPAVPGCVPDDPPSRSSRLRSRSIRDRCLEIRSQRIPFDPSIADAQLCVRGKNCPKLPTGLPPVPPALPLVRGPVPPALALPLVRGPVPPALPLVTTALLLLLAETVPLPSAVVLPRSTTALGSRGTVAALCEDVFAVENRFRFFVGAFLVGAAFDEKPHPRSQPLAPRAP